MIDFLLKKTGIGSSLTGKLHLNSTIFEYIQNSDFKDGYEPYQITLRLVIPNENGEFAIVQRSQGRSQERLYEYPGGKFNEAKDKNYYNTIIREGVTETGLTILGITGHLGYVDAMVKSKEHGVLRIREHLFKAVPYSRQKIEEAAHTNKGEHDNILFVNKQTINNYVLTEESKKLFNEVHEPKINSNLACQDCGSIQKINGKKIISLFTGNYNACCDSK